jgi:glycosyltransferase involved in cell wall biosynthesis
VAGHPIVDPEALVGARSFGIWSRFPPAVDGIATFSATLAAALVAHGAAVDVVRRGSDGAPDALNDAEVAIVEHADSASTGRDGEDVIDLLEALSVPSIVVVHTALRRPTPHQRCVLAEVCVAADAVVVTTEHARRRLAEDFDIGAGVISVIPLGATMQPSDDGTPVERCPGARLRLLTWGFLGPGKGIEWAIDAMASLTDVRPHPSYLVAGATHPKVQAANGEAYRVMLMERCWRTGACRSVSFDDSYLDRPALTRLISSADIVVLPYDSDDQVTSGVLVDAVACGRPVIATAFPQAIELLSSGAGVVVPLRDASALADVVRSVLDHPELLAEMAGECRRRAPELSWPAIARRYDELATALLIAPTNSLTDQEVTNHA